MGPLISARQERRVLGYLDIGRAEGAEVVDRRAQARLALRTTAGFFVEPTIFDRRHAGHADRAGGDLRAGALGAELRLARTRRSRSPTGPSTG